MLGSSAGANHLRGGEHAGRISVPAGATFYAADEWRGRSRLYPRIANLRALPVRLLASF